MTFLRKNFYQKINKKKLLLICVKFNDISKLFNKKYELSFVQQFTVE